MGEVKSVNLLDAQKAYNKTIQQVSRYIGLQGMFELKEGQEYSPFNNTNEDMFTWKKYDVAKTLRTNKH